MKRYRAELSPEDRKSWRWWKAWSICIYIVIVAALMGIGSLVPGPDYTDQISLSKKMELSARGSSD